MDKLTRNIIIAAISIITIVVVGVGGFMVGRSVNGLTVNDGYGPMMGFRRGQGRWISPSFTEDISIEDAEEAVNNYISLINSDEDLRVGEIMIFDNHTYAQVIEEDTDVGAFEVIVDPGSLNVNLEQGASMMWNLKYGHKRGSMMGGSIFTEDGRDMPISETEAISIASEYLENAESELTVDDHADRFYGYYTLHTLENGEITGMLSVNGYSGQIIIHNWHGELIEMEDHLETDH